LYFRTLLAPTAPTTAAATAISAVSATSGGSVVTDGNPSISDKGICWGTSSGPVYNGSHSHPATVTGASSFTCATGTLVPGTHYYLRAWVWNSLGPVYGNEVQFDAGIPSVSTGTPSAVTAVSASVVGTITTNGDTVGERGVCYVLGSGTPTTSNTKAIGSGNPYTSTLTLSPGATYQAKTYIIDSGGSTRYGGQISITAGVPSATTSSVSSITAITAASGVSVTPNGDTIGARGVCWGTSPSPDTSGVHSEAFSGDNVGVSMGAIIPLIPNTTYYVRAYVVGSNSVPYYGSQLSFLTLSNAHTMSLSDVGKL
jgi:hypothetical protein